MVPRSKWIRTGCRHQWQSALNDRYGHATGDLVLQSVVAQIKQELRPSDFVGRMEAPMEWRLSECDLHIALTVERCR